MQEFFQHTKRMLIALFESIKIILKLKKSVFSNNVYLATFQKKVPNLSMTYYLTRELNKHIIFASTKDNWGNNYADYFGKPLNLATWKTFLCFYRNWNIEPCISFKTTFLFVLAFLSSQEFHFLGPSIFKYFFKHHWLDRRHHWIEDLNWT